MKSNEPYCRQPPETEPQQIPETIKVLVGFAIARRGQGKVSTKRHVSMLPETMQMQISDVICYASETSAL